MQVDHYSGTHQFEEDKPQGRHFTFSGTWVDLLGYLMVLGLLMYLLYLFFAPQPLSDADVSLPEQTTEELGRTSSSTDTGRSIDAVVLRRPSDAEVVGSGSQFTGPNLESTDSVQLIEQLVALQQRPEWTLLDSDIAILKRALAQLVQQGGAALPAIRQYLTTLSDTDGPALNALGYPSLRLALFDVVGQIGGGQAEDILYRELQSTTSPLEIETLGRYLAAQAPGLYDAEILSAAQGRFELVQKEAGLRVDAGPLFKVFSQYGDSRLVPELENISQLNWGRYGAVALSRIPDGAGLASLSRWIEEGPEGNTSAEFALRILAQSSEYPEAQQALLNTVREGRVPRENWNEIARLLMGTYHIQLEPPEQGLYRGDEGYLRSVSLIKSSQYISLTPAGPQVVYGLQTSEPALSPGQIAPRLELIDALLAETEDPVARRELVQAENMLWKLFQQQEQ